MCLISYACQKPFKTPTPSTLHPPANNASGWNTEKETPQRLNKVKVQCAVWRKCTSCRSCSALLNTKEIQHHSRGLCILDSCSQSKITGQLSGLKVAAYRAGHTFISAVGHLSGFDLLSKNSGGRLPSTPTTDENTDVTLVKQLCVVTRYCSGLLLFSCGAKFGSLTHFRRPG